jgi:plasmid stabilization system protein ParE
MARGDKSTYTDKQKRQAEHIEKGYKQRGVSEDEAERRAWATVNKESGGGKKSGSGRKTPSRKTPSRKTPSRKTPSRKTASRKTASRKAPSRKKKSD